MTVQHRRFIGAWQPRKVLVATKLTTKDAEREREREREREGAEWPYLAFPEELWLSENTALLRRDAQPGSHRQPSPLCLHSAIMLAAIRMEGFLILPPNLYWARLHFQTKICLYVKRGH